MNRSSAVHSVGVCENRRWDTSWNDIPYPGYEAEQFSRGVLFAGVFEVPFVGAGMLIWELKVSVL
jgi:hypothetical protein